MKNYKTKKWQVWVDFKCSSYQDQLGTVSVLRPKIQAELAVLRREEITCYILTVLYNDRVEYLEYISANVTNISMYVLNNLQVTASEIR